MLKGAIVGFGEVARYGHWPAYASSDEVEIVAVVDRTAARRDLALRLLPRVATFATLDDLARATGPTIDFIDICTPPALHVDPLVAALGRRWHVLCEKPLLLEPAIVESVRQRALAGSLAVVPVHNWKYAPILRRTTALMREGAIGTLRRVRIETCRLCAAPTVEGNGPNWRRDLTIAGGGILMDHGWHAVYLALQWFDARPTAVAASLRWPVAGGVEDEATVALSFPSGETLITLTWNGNQRRNTMRLTGDAGELFVDDDTLHVDGAFSERIGFCDALSDGSHHPDWFAAMLPDVVAAFKRPWLAHRGFEEAVACLSVIRQAYGSAAVMSGAR